MKKQDFKVLKTKDLYPFPDNPFHVVEDETLSELAESIKEFGIVTPITSLPLWCSCIRPAESSPTAVLNTS